MAKILNIAHRGASGAYPENSMLSFKKAIEMGCDGLEVDVQLSSDGEVVIFHDKKLDRVTNGSGLLCQHSFAELKKLEITNNNQDNKFALQRIVSLKELLKMLQENEIFLNIELKNIYIDYPGLEEKVYQLLKEFEMIDRVVISSFNHYSLQRFAQISKEVGLGIIYLANLIDPIAYAESLGFKLRSFHPLYSSLDKERVKKIKNAGYDIFTYTVNDKNDITYVSDLEVDGIITDYPDRI
ncbi:glycerophosphodiester phosphodiesterase [Halanaerobium hydrogeniformans]|uniref:Glycerophosphoryl diester phosphodiesterase n=1 Tax=Halanaerobium hydrogeniformans TaxID=656519 RepID=E4RPT2_HALHG|nr:glycerophosphodiester phosphodiesterase [Halanaerobium hydrogeniformans]ADQ13966.1 glycerophosphoryl diester phosphodiesterase [Halanaerobium hydrogeniformans]